MIKMPKNAKLIKVNDMQGFLWHAIFKSEMNNVKCLRGYKEYYLQRIYLPHGWSLSMVIVLFKF